MPAEEVDELMKVADPKNEGFVDILDFADSICPPKKWEKNILNVDLEILEDKL